MNRESASLKLVDEYYTFEGFTGKESYKINDEMIFIKTLGVKLTNTVNMFSYESSSNRKYTPNLGINEETIDTEFPLISQNVLLFCGKTRSKSPIFKPTKAIIIPSYQCPLFRLLPINQSKYLTNEFLYYCKSTGEEFVVYVLNRFDIDVVEFAFYRQNGKYENSIFLKMQGIRNYKDVKVIVSPNGRYVFYVEEEQEDDKDIPDSSRQNLRNKRQFIGKVSEIVTLRSKEQGIKMKNIVKHHKRSNPANLKQMLKESIDSEASFTLKAIQTIKDAGNCFSIFHHSFGNNDSMQLFVTDKGSIVFVDKVNNMLFFNNTDMSKACKNKLGLKEDGKTEYQIKDLNWCFSDNGLVGYSSEDAIYLEINLKRMKVKKIKKIAFKINKDRLYVKSINFCPNSRYILICFSTNYDELVLVIWDLKVNSEKFNLSLDKNFAYINKPGGCYGIVLCGSYYINLDIGLMNSYFDHDFFDYPWTNKQQGFKMDRSENIILYKGELLMKEMYSECEVLQSLINGDTVYNERTYSDKLSESQMVIQIEGNTILHLPYNRLSKPKQNCKNLDYVPLNLMLNFMNKKHPEMLSSILMKNHKGETPLDIAIRYESTKTIDIFFKYLAQLDEGGLSRLIQNNFPKLFKLGLLSFYEYLNSCYYQTNQMKGIKFLNLKDESFITKTVLPHKNCLIDDEFLKKYTNMLNKHKESKDNEKNKDTIFSIFDNNDSLHIENGFINTEENKNCAEIKIKSIHKSISSISSNKHINCSNDHIDLNDIHIRENNLNHSSENNNSEENEGGEEVVVNMKNNISYNPNYSVFNKDEQPYTLRSDASSENGSTTLNTKYFYDHIASENDQIKEFREQILVPPKTVMMTELEEQRMRELKQKVQEEIQSAQTKQIGGHAPNRRQSRYDKSKLTEKEIAELKEKERIEYYRENIKKKLTVFKIKAIEFDWLFENEGMKFMHSVAQSRSIEVFSLDIIKTIVLFFWQYYKIRIIIFSLIPFLLNFLVMFAYVTYIHNYNNNRNNNATIDWQNFKNWDNMKYADYALMLTILLLAFYQFILELLYLFQMRLRYISSFWNLINLLSIGLNVASVVFDYQNTGESQYWIPVSSSAMIIMWLRLFYFGRIINATSTIVRMIIEISKDMIPFLIIVFIIVFGFTNSFFVIATITYDDSPRFTTNNFFLAVAWTWRNGIGDFQPADFSANRYLHLCKVIWLLCTFFVMIVFLNLLIAVLSDSFDKIQETLENNLLKEMAIMMSENEILINRKRVFKDMKYLIVVQKVLSKKAYSGWGGRLNYVNTIVKNTRNAHFAKMDDISKNIENHFDFHTFRKASEMEVKYEKSLNYLSDKVDRLDNTAKQYQDFYHAFTKR